MTRLRRIIAKLARGALLVAALGGGLGGCVLNRELARQADGVVSIQQDRTITCRKADRCAIDSPLRGLSADALRDATPAAPVHYVDLLEHGEDALLLRVHLIRAARESIDIQSFIWAEDDAGWLILDELVAAARRGVRVRILVDQLFALDDVEWLARLARAHANLEVRLFNPTFDDAVTQPLEFAAGLLCCFTRFNQRMHNKLFLVDGTYGIGGGRNYEDRYFDWDPAFDYRDREVLVIGARAGAEMQASFDEFWNYRRSVPLTRLNDVNRRIVADARDLIRDHADVRRAGMLRAPPDANWPRIEALRGRATDASTIRRLFVDDAVRVGEVDYFSDAPDKSSDAEDDDQALTRQIGEMLRSAEHRILMQTPYLVITGRARKLFRELAQRTPRVEVEVSTNSLASTDAFYVYALSHKYKKRYLRQLRFRIHESKPFPADAAQMIRNYERLAGGANSGDYERFAEAPLTREGTRIGLHAKSIVIDATTTLVGSHNFDPRSNNYNTESGFIIHDREVAARVADAILRDIAPRNAWVIAKRPRPALIERINNAIADFSTALPLFDFWPFRYATSFELDPGCDPLPPDDPGFYDCYTNVGAFPQVDLPLKTIYTRIATAFGAGFVGIL
jgi:phosphatidylserine/phosphatidylglycerophosphate/cardiolipin synthase-like enzyme